MMPRHILTKFGIEEEMMQVVPFGTGLINHTWKIELPGREFILQRINDSVFSDPLKIAYNIRAIADHLRTHHPDYKFIAPVTTQEGKEMCNESTGFYRMFPFVAGSHTVDVVQTPAQAYEAAVQFGRFTRLLSGFDYHKLHITIPSFHDLELRYEQFLTALKEGDRRRVLDAEELIRTVIGHAGIVSEYTMIKSHPGFKLRVTHHDSKISNVLFDSGDRGICVIDLDTVMPGYFISDVGDMLRTYLSPVSEEEKDTSKIVIRDEYYEAVIKGYYQEMKEELTETEKDHFFYAGKFMIYMQAIRFLTDHLNNDRYYGAKYPGHNFYRARNQLVLLQQLLEKERSLVNYKLD